MFHLLCGSPFSSFFFFFNDTATTEIYTLSLHDALPISRIRNWWARQEPWEQPWAWCDGGALWGTDDSRRPSMTDRKSTRLNSSHQIISYAVFCLKKKKKKQTSDKTLFTSHVVNRITIAS